MPDYPHLKIKIGKFCLATLLQWMNFSLLKYCHFYQSYTVMAQAQNAYEHEYETYDPIDNTTRRVTTKKPTHPKKTDKTKQTKISLVISL